MLNHHNKFNLNKKKTFVTITSILLVTIISCTIGAISCTQPPESPETNQPDNSDVQATETSKTEQLQKSDVHEIENNKTEQLNNSGKSNSTPTKKNIANNKKENTELEQADKVEEINQSCPNTSEEDYTKLYPDLYCTRPETQITPSKTIFLTFDDGPSDRTSEVLEILRQNNIKATFFVTGNATQKGINLMKQIVDEGHTIAVHTYTHAFREVYASVQAFLDDFNKIYNLIYQNTGVKPTIFRFPGGSKNSFNKDNYKEIIAEMTRRGFDYFDWNLSVGDAVSRTPTPTQKCIDNVLNYSKNCDHGVVLLHDAQPKTTTVEALPHIINGLKEQGFVFDKLSNNIDPAPYSLVKPYR